MSLTGVYSPGSMPVCCPAQCCYCGLDGVTLGLYSAYEKGILTGQQLALTRHFFDQVEDSKKEKEREGEREGERESIHAHLFKRQQLKYQLTLFGT